MPSSNSNNMPPQQLKSDEVIQAAAFEFWGAVLDSFPEVIHGDSTITDADAAAFAIWANGEPGDRSDDLYRLPLPEGYNDERVAQAVKLARDKAAATLFAGGEVPPCPQATQDILTSCIHHMLYYNAPSPVPTGSFEVHVYETEAEWVAAKGAGDIEPGFESFSEAKTYADGDQFKDMYQVTIRAEGEHAAHEPGEEIYTRFERDDPAIPKRRLAPR